MNAFKEDPALYIFTLLDLLLAGVTEYFYIGAETYWDDTGIIAENERTTGMILGTFFLLLTIGGLIFIIYEIKDTNLKTKLYGKSKDRNIYKRRREIEEEINEIKKDQIRLLERKAEIEKNLFARESVIENRDK